MASECCKIESGSLISRSENGRKINLINNNRIDVEVWIVDDCLIKGSEERCDFQFVFNANRILVEFKGKDVCKAITQIVNTARLLNYNEITGAKICYIVSNRVPKASTTVQKKILQLSKTFQSFGLKIPVIKNVTVEHIL